MTDDTTRTKDLVKKLRSGNQANEVQTQAADALERLAAEVERLKAEGKASAPESEAKPKQP